MKSFCLDFRAARHEQIKKRHLMWKTVFKKVEWRHRGDFYASVVIQKTYGEIHNGQFTFERKRRKINCLTKKVTLCFSTPYVCLDKFWLNNLWLLLFGSPKHYFLLGLFFCQLFQLGSAWHINTPVCGYHYITALYSCSLTHTPFIILF